jgi:hypothetical protein
MKRYGTAFSGAAKEKSNDAGASKSGQKGDFWKNVKKSQISEEQRARLEELEKKYPTRKLWREMTPEEKEEDRQKRAREAEERRKKNPNPRADIPIGHIEPVVERRIEKLGEGEDTWGKIAKLIPQEQLDAEAAERESHFIPGGNHHSNWSRETTPSPSGIDWSIDLVPKFLESIPDVCPQDPTPRNPPKPLSFDTIDQLRQHYAITGDPVTLPFHQKALYHHVTGSTAVPKEIQALMEISAWCWPIGLERPKIPGPWPTPQEMALRAAIIKDRKIRERNQEIVSGKPLHIRV